MENQVLFLTYGQEWAQLSPWAATINSFCSVTDTSKGPWLRTRALSKGSSPFGESVALGVLLCVCEGFVLLFPLVINWFPAAAIVWNLLVSFLGGLLDPPFVSSPQPLSPCSVVKSVEMFPSLGWLRDTAGLWQLHVSPALAVVPAETQGSPLGQRSISCTLWQCCRAELLLWGEGCPSSQTATLPALSGRGSAAPVSGQASSCSLGLEWSWGCQHPLHPHCPWEAAQKMVQGRWVQKGVPVLAASQRW